jgi:hypothetical protein
MSALPSLDGANACRRDSDQTDDYDFPVPTLSRATAVPMRRDLLYRTIELSEVSQPFI